MWASDNIIPHAKDLQMDAKDERLTLMAYNIGRLEQYEYQLNDLKHKLTGAETRADRAEANDSWTKEKLDRLQNTYDKLNNYTLKLEKKLAKLKENK